MPFVIESVSPPLGYPYAITASLMPGSAEARASAWCESKKLSSSSFSTARSIPGAIPSTAAEILSPAWFA